MSPGSKVLLPKADMTRRLGGSGIEFLTLIALEIASAFLLPIGIVMSILAAIYMAVKDQGGGRFSIGKRIAHTRVVDAETGEVPDPLRLFLRNSVFVAAWVIAVIPGVEIFGWGLLALAGLVDLLMVIADPLGRRLGDRIAGTQVVPIAVER